jgi:hypothetical protein
MIGDFSETARNAEPESATSLLVRLVDAIDLATEKEQERKRERDAERIRKRKSRRFPPDAHLKGGRNAAIVNRAMARGFYWALIPIVSELRAQGLSLRAIAAELERRGIRTRYMWRRWSANQVRRILARTPIGFRRSWPVNDRSPAFDSGRNKTPSS